MSKLFTSIVAVGCFIGWIVYLAGIASSNDLCVKLNKGTLAITDVITSINDPTKFVPISPAFSQLSSIASQAMPTGRKMLSIESVAGLANHGRELLDAASDSCGWSLSFFWWTIALQGLATFGILAIAFTASEMIAKLRPAMFAKLAINTALLCYNASIVIPITYNMNQIGAKGKMISAIYATAAGLIITLIFNFTWFIASSLEDTHAVQPVVK